MTSDEKIISDFCFSFLKTGTVNSQFDLSSRHTNVIFRFFYSFAPIGDSASICPAMWWPVKDVLSKAKELLPKDVDVKKLIIRISLIGEAYPVDYENTNAKDQRVGTNAIYAKSESGEMNCCDDISSYLLGNSFKKIIESLAKSFTAKITQVSAAPIKSFLSDSDGIIVPLKKGSQVITEAEVNQKEILRRLKLAASWMRRNNHRKFYDPVELTPSKDANINDQLEAWWALNKYLGIFNDKQLFRYSAEWQKSFFPKLRTSRNSIRIGETSTSNALFVLGLLSISQRKQEKLIELVKALKIITNSGNLSTRGYYSEETIYALVLYHSRTDGLTMEVLEHIGDSAKKYMATKTPERLSYYMAEAFFILSKKTNDLSFIEYCINKMDDLFNTGGKTDGTSFQVAADSRALIACLRMACLIKDKTRSDFYRNRLISGIRYLFQIQSGSKLNSMYFKEPEKVIGGVFLNSNDLNQTLNSTAQFMHVLINTYSLFFTENNKK